MRRLASVRLARAAAPKDPTALFGSGCGRTAAQRRVFQRLKHSTIQQSFPHLAACWVGPCWGTVMQTPSTVSPVCVKMAVWRCSQCLREFEKSIAKFVDSGGVCPLCHRTQKQLPEHHTTAHADATTTARHDGDGDDNARTAAATNGTTAAAVTTSRPIPHYVKAPRMVHSHYRSVLASNPEWEHKNIQPMLAQRWESVANELLAKSQRGHEELLLASPKIDGIRCIVGYNTPRREVQFFSRGGIMLECCHGLVDELLPLFERDPDLMLDGELFAPECNFEQLNGLVRRLAKTTPPQVRQAQRRLLEYFAFDIMYSARLSSVAAPFDERYRLLKTLIPVCGAKRISNYQHDEKKKKVIRTRHSGSHAADGDSSSNSDSNNHAATADNNNNNDHAATTTTTRVRVYHVPAAQVLPEEMNDVLSEACSQGFEGVMIRRPSFPYEHGKRSFGLLKYKQMHDAEFKVVDFMPGEGRFKGALGAFICETRDGHRFSAPPKVPYQRRVTMWAERHKYLGKYMTVQYQELSSQDVPRFPIAKCVRGAADASDWL